jgi:peptide/nickel transport system ATP-binding protein
MSRSISALLQMEGLSVDYWDRLTWVNVVHRVSFSIDPGETLGLAGESGCGKSTTAYALVGYKRLGSRIREGKVLFRGRDLLQLDHREIQRIRGAEISLVPQNPGGTLNPKIRVGAQVEEVLSIHHFCRTRGDTRQRVLELLQSVELPQPAEIATRYPHQLSGGQQQRVVIAMALACNPDMVILDEPTTDLDVTTQAQILKLLGRLQLELEMAMLYITHNLGVLAQITNRVAVMYAGELIEVAPTKELYENSRHPYTQGLIAAVPRVSATGQTTVPLMRGLLRRDQLPEGCRFAPRCNYAEPKCFASPQDLVAVGASHLVACRRWAEIPRLCDRLAEFAGSQPLYNTTG